MKKMWFVMVTVMVVLSGCSAKKNDFKLELLTDKKIYKSNEPIIVWANFRYNGNQEVIKIAHARDYISFSIKQLDGWFESQGFVADIHATSQIKRGIVYRKDYVKSGGYSIDSSYSAFYENFYKEKDLLLPKGTYKITAYVDFDLVKQLKVGNGINVNEGNKKTNMQSEITINVVN